MRKTSSHGVDRCTVRAFLGLKKSGVGPPLCFSRTCLHVAFLAFSVLRVCDCQQLFHWLRVLLPVLPGLGRRQGLHGSGL